jgi:hypothetical protein
MTLHKTRIIPFSPIFAIKGPCDDTLLAAVQKTVEQMIPEPLWNESTDLFSQLKKSLPTFHYSPLDDYSTFVTITVLCPAEHAQGVKHFYIDGISRLSEKAEVVGSMSLYFEFQNYPSLKFYIAQKTVAIRNQEELQSIRRHLPELIDDAKKKLPREWMRQSENIVHPIFMPRNEEELFRNLTDLTRQVKYIRDLPQVSIHFEKQTEIDLTFTVIVARLLKENETEPLQKLLEKSSLKIDIDDVRVMGYLKQKYPKESAILRVTLVKRPFFRPDFSVDLLKARQKIVAQLTQALGEFRDFNGGMILKQDEALAQLRLASGQLTKEKEFLLENYFYSLRPPIMQTVIDPSILKRHHELLNLSLDSDLRLEPYRILTDSTEKYFLCFIAATDPAFKADVLSAIGDLKISTRELTSSSIEIDKHSMLGFILRLDNPELQEILETTIRHTLREWGRGYVCELKEKTY